ncbi:MAG: LolA family protein [Caldimicrobium sp.]
MVYVLALLLILVNPFKKGVFAQSVEEVISKIQSFYRETESIRGSFTQETIFPYGQREVRRGNFWMKKPGLFRWEYLTPDKFLIISDGRNIYVYYPEEKQVYVYPSGKAISSQLALGFMSGRGDITKDLKLESFKVLSNNLWELSFLPTYKEEQVEKIILHVLYPKGEVKEVLIHYLSGEKVKIIFDKLEYNLELPMRIFQFKPPKNAQINQ